MTLLISSDNCLQCNYSLLTSERIDWKRRQRHEADGTTYSWCKMHDTGWRLVNLCIRYRQTVMPPSTVLSAACRTPAAQPNINYAKTTSCVEMTSLGLYPKHQPKNNTQ